MSPDYSCVTCVIGVVWNGLLGEAVAVIGSNCKMVEGVVLDKLCVDGNEGEDDIIGNIDCKNASAIAAVSFVVVSGVG